MRTICDTLPADAREGLLTAPGTDEVFPRWTDSPDPRTCLRT
ncbi:hypothetical protein ACIQVT_20365 [Streptomyces sp. NPDC100445]